MLPCLYTAILHYVHTITCICKDAVCGLQAMELTFDAITDLPRANVQSFDDKATCYSLYVRKFKLAGVQQQV